MNRNGAPRRAGYALAAVLLATASSLSMTAAQAQQAVERRFTFDIPSKPVPQAVNDIGRVTGLSVVYPENKPIAASSRSVHGSMTVGQALSTLLAGTGLSYRFSNATTVMILDPSAQSGASGTGTASGAIPLDTIDVQGASETAWGPVDGYVARQSATGTKTDTPLIETPRTVTVITRDEIAAQQAQSVRDTVRYAPGVYYSDDADFRYEPVSARGFSLDQYLDGLKLLNGTWSVPRVDPYFLERAEVLEGPASTLYGQASPGGVLDMISKRPTATPVHEIQLSTGSYGLAQTAFDLGGPIDKDGKLLYRLTGIARTSGTQVDYVDKQRIAIAPSITWRPDADTSLTILTSVLNDPKAGFWNLLPYQGTLLPNTYGKIPRNFYVGDPSFEHYSFTQAMAGYQFEHRFDETWTVRQSARFTRIDIDYREVQGYLLEADQHTLDRYAYTANENLNTFNIDNQAQAKFDTGPLAHTVLLGLDYQHLDWNNFTRYGNTASLDILNPNYAQTISLPPVFQDAHQTQNQLGLYAQDQIKSGGFVFTLGGRQDWVSTDTYNRLANKMTQQSDRSFTWHTGLLYRFDNGFAPYVSYATSFQPTSGTTAEGASFKPTTGQQYEAGIKYQPPGWNALLTAAVFDLTQQNVLTSDPDASHPAGSQVQTGEVRSRGVELSAVTSLKNGLSLRASYTYLDNRITQANDGTIGHILNNTPRNFAAVWGDYTIQDGPLAGLGFGGGVRYVGSSYATNANTYAIPDFTLIDAAIHYDFGKLRPDLKGLTAKVNATNLFDKVYVSYCSAVGCRWGEGRTVYATLSYKW